MGADPLPQPAAQGNSVTRLGVIAPLPAEARCFIGRRVRPGELLSLPGGGWLKVSGIGNARASRAAEELAERGATALLSWGTAGGLDQSLRPGSVIVPKRVLRTEGPSLLVDAEWRDALWRVLAGHVSLCDGAIVESPDVLACPQDKAMLSQRFGAVAVDMESDAIGIVAQQLGMPFMAVRVVVDPGWQSLPSAALKAVDGDGHMLLRRLLVDLARQPSQLVALARLAAQFRTAQAALRTIATVAMPVLRGPPVSAISLVHSARHP